MVGARSEPASAPALAARPAGLALQAGAIATTWRAGRLERLVVDGHEVWHGVHFLLRDPHWRTPSLLLGAPVVERAADAAGSWRLGVEGWFDVSEAVRLRVTVEGAPPQASDIGRLVVTGEAFIEREVDVNRLGLCLLHPLAAAGRAVEVLHDDGRWTRSTLPELVPAWPPFTAIRAIRHEYAPGAWAFAEFEGDIFELEDQRNNADASFKTYARSNFMPRPYRLRAGEVVRQRVTLRVEQRPSTPRPPSPFVPVAWPGHVVADPSPARLGVEVTAADLQAEGEASTAAAATVAALRPDHLHVTWPASGSAPEWAPWRALAGLLEAAGPQAGLRLDVVDLPAAGEAVALEVLARGLRDAGLAPGRRAGDSGWDIAVFPTTAEAVQAARAAFPGARIGGGTRDFFVQLHRSERLPALDFLSFTVCPIVHAADDATLMEGHASLAGMVATLAAKHPGVPVHLGPSTIAARRSPLGELAPSDGPRRVPLAGVDPRDGTAFGAAWTVAHVAAALAAGVRVLTVSRLALCGAGSPVGELLGRLGDRRRPGGLAASPPGDEGPLRALALDSPRGHEVVWVNGDDESQPLALPPGCAPRWALSPGPGPAVAEAGEGLLRLAPYGVVGIGAAQGTGGG